MKKGKTLKKQPLKSVLTAEDHELWLQFSRYVGAIQAKPFLGYSGFNKPLHHEAGLYKKATAPQNPMHKQAQLELSQAKKASHKALISTHENASAFSAKGNKKAKAHYVNIKTLQKKDSLKPPHLSAYSQDIVLFKDESSLKWHKPGFVTKAGRVDKKANANKHAATIRKLDLHGLTVHEAFMRFYDFILKAYKDNIGCVEIITGMGGGSSGGIIKRELPLWLERTDVMRLVISVTYSSPRNMGSLRVILRKNPIGPASFFPA